MSLYINTVTGSRDLEGCAIDKAVMQIAARLFEARKSMQFNEQGRLELTLVLPGKDIKPDFSGMRMTGFSRDEGTLYIESAVPEAMLHSEHAERYVSALVQDAVENAGAFFDEVGVGFEVVGV